MKSSYEHRENFIESLKYMWAEGESLLEFDTQVRNGGLNLEFGIPKEEVDVSAILRYLVICIGVAQENGLGWFWSVIRNFCRREFAREGLWVDARPTVSLAYCAR